MTDSGLLNISCIFRTKTSLTNAKTKYRNEGETRQPGNDLDGCHYWSRNCLPFQNTRVHPRIYYGFVLLEIIVFFVSFFIWSLHCLSFLDLRLVDTLLVSSTISWMPVENEQTRFPNPWCLTYNDKWHYSINTTVIVVNSQYCRILWICVFRLWYFALLYLTNVILSNQIVIVCTVPYLTAILRVKFHVYYIQIRL